MKNTTPMDAYALLALPDARANELFTGGWDEMKAAYRRLVHRWHPDHNADPQAHEVFIRVQSLYQAATRRKREALVEFTTNTGQRFQFHSQQKTRFELGSVYRGRGSLGYFLEKHHDDKALHFQRMIQNLVFANDAMKTQISPCLPSLRGVYQGDLGSLVVIRRDQEGILLRDVLDHYISQGRAIDPRHVGWILNCLHNLACFFSHTGIAHQGIGLDTVWINPRKHSVQLLGGWFHSLAIGGRIHALPGYSASFAPRSYLEGKVATGRLDQECIRGIGRTLLGDASGQRFDRKTPKQITSLLRLPATGTALEEYQRWKQALLASYGPPKFVAMELSFSDIYKGE